MITGLFNNIFIFTIIILIHEFGHLITGFLLGWKVERIDIYPYGGCTRFNNDLNTSMLKEFLVLIAGPLTQIVFFFVLKDYLRFNDYLLFRKYNYAILIFNLLPIYPLDGGRLLNLIISHFLSYKKSILWSINISLFMCGIFFFKIESLTMILVLLMLISNIYSEIKNVNYYYNKFLLERFLNKYGFKKIKIVKSIDYFYRSKKHVVLHSNKYYSEDEILNKKFLNVNKCKVY